MDCLAKFLFSAPNSDGMNSNVILRVSAEMLFIPSELGALN